MYDANMYAYIFMSYKSAPTVDSTCTTHTLIKGCVVLYMSKRRTSRNNQDTEARPMKPKHCPQTKSTDCPHRWIIYKTCTKGFRRTRYRKCTLCSATSKESYRITSSGKRIVECKQCGCNIEVSQG